MEEKELNRKDIPRIGRTGVFDSACNKSKP